jgi:hypothetical protein
VFSQRVLCLYINFVKLVGVGAFHLENRQSRMSSASKDANGEFDGDKHPKQLLGVQYIDIQWLSTYGLTKSNVLEYFYTSPFFNTNSNNQIIRIQGVEHAQRETILLSMTGVEYILDDLNTVEPNLFVIREQRRRSRRLADVDLINVYYVLDGIGTCQQFNLT